MEKKIEYIGIIPARFGSTRFEGKPLIKIGNQSMIERTYRRAALTDSLKKIIVATDDIRIFNHVQSFGGEVLMTKNTHLTGTDRIGEVLEKICADYPDLKGIVNIQGDEPFISPQQIESVVKLLKNNYEIGTLCKKIENWEDIFNSNVVKLVKNKNGRALFFSRSPIPHVRSVSMNEKWISATDFFKHIGLYGFKIDTFKKIINLAPSPLELVESLEQLRWLENGFEIGVAETDFETIAIDTPADLKKLDWNHIND